MAERAVAQECAPPSVAPAVVVYRAFDGQEYTLSAWPGRHLVILTPDADRCEATMQALLAEYDEAYEFYADATGREPVSWPATVLFGRATLAVVPDGATCGAACGYLGFTGIELTRSLFESTYEGRRDHGWQGGTTNYELGRNFWFFSDRLEYLPEEGKWSNLSTTFASFMSLVLVDALGLDAGPFQGRSYAEYMQDRFDIVDTYVADPGLTWANAIRVEAFPSFTRSPNVDVVASFLHRVQAVHGLDWVKRLWREVGLRPPRITTEDAVDNLVLASSAAARANLTGVFADLWRWPVSASARAEALDRFGDPVDPGPYRATCGNGAIEVGEGCDGGACCSSRCQHQMIGTPCDADDTLCSEETCDGDGICVPVFGTASSCTPVGRSKLRVVAGTSRRNSRVELQWKAGAKLTPGDFGTPVEETSYELCLYAEDVGPRLFLTTSQPSIVGGCARASCWKSRAGGWTYGGRTGAGRVTLELARTSGRRTIVRMSTMGGTLPILPLTTGVSLVAELRTSGGQCFGVRFERLLKNDERGFVARR